MNLLGQSYQHKVNTFQILPRVIMFIPHLISIPQYREDLMESRWALLVSQNVRISFFPKLSRDPTVSVCVH